MKWNFELTGPDPYHFTRKLCMRNVIMSTKLRLLVTKLNVLDSERPIKGPENKGCTVAVQRVNREQFPTRAGTESAVIKQLNYGLNQ